MWLTAALHFGISATADRHSSCGLASHERQEKKLGLATGVMLYHRSAACHGIHDRPNPVTFVWAHEIILNEAVQCGSLEITE